MRDRIVLWLLPDVIVSILPWTHVELLLAIPQVLAHGSLNILVSNASKHSDLPASTALQLVAKPNKLTQQLLPYARQGSSKHADIVVVRWPRNVPGQLYLHKCSKICRPCQQLTHRGPTALPHRSGQSKHWLHQEPDQDGQSTLIKQSTSLNYSWWVYQ